MDMVLRNARIDDRPAACVQNIGIEHGRSVAIGAGLRAARHELDVGGRLMTGGFVESHIHLDKSCILDRCKSERGNLEEAIGEVAKAKAGFTPEDVYARGKSPSRKAS